MTSPARTLSIELTPDEARGLDAIAEKLSVTPEQLLHRLVERAVKRMVVTWGEEHDPPIVLAASDFEHLLDELDQVVEPPTALHELMLRPGVLEQ